jgi:hypothetical protein
MGHQTEHVSAFTDDSRDVALGSIRVGVGTDGATSIRVFEDDASLSLELVENVGGRDVTPVTVSYRHAQNVAAIVQVREHRVVILDTNPHFGRDELEVRVAHQRAGKEAGLTGDLKTVADREHRSACLRVRNYILHYRTEARDRTGA